MFLRLSYFEKIGGKATLDGRVNSLTDGRTDRRTGRGGAKLNAAHREGRSSESNESIL